MKQFTAQPLLSQRYLLGEGPCWLAATGELLWVNIKTGLLCRWNSQDNTYSEMQTGQYLGSAVPAKSGRFLAAMTTGVYLLGDREIRAVGKPADLTTNYHLNDGKCDPAGRFWFGTVGMVSRAPGGFLFRLDPDGSFHRMLTGVRISNGLAWSADGKTMYYVDTRTDRVDAFDFGADGGITNRRTVIRIQGPGHPDGMCIDAEGKLWVALWGGCRVVRYDPATGEALAEVLVPAEQVTSCCFGGSGLDTLYITTAYEGFDDPAAGKVYFTKPGVKGAPVTLFDDSILLKKN